MRFTSEVGMTYYKSTLIKINLWKTTQKNQVLQLHSHLLTCFFYMILLRQKYNIGQEVIKEQERLFLLRDELYRGVLEYKYEHIHIDRE